MKTKSVFREKDKITKWILSDGQEMNRVDITANYFPKLKENVDKIAKHDSDKVFALNQKSLLLKAQIMWYDDVDESQKITTRDTRESLFGLLFQ